MQFSHEVEQMCKVAKGPKHGPAPIPEEGRWIKPYQISDISGLSHGIGWCAPQQGTCKLTLNAKNGIIEEALVETIGCGSDQIKGKIINIKIARPGPQAEIVSSTPNAPALTKLYIRHISIIPESECCFIPLPSFPAFTFSVTFNAFKHSSSKSLISFSSSN